jgi:hypothetical protein
MPFSAHHINRAAIASETAIVKNVFKNGVFFEFSNRKKIRN